MFSAEMGLRDGLELTDTVSISQHGLFSMKASKLRVQTSTAEDLIRRREAGHLAEGGKGVPQHELLWDMALCSYVCVLMQSIHGNSGIAVSHRRITNGRIRMQQHTLVCVRDLLPTWQALSSTPCALSQASIDG